MLSAMSIDSAIQSFPKPLGRYSEGLNGGESNNKESDVVCRNEGKHKLS